MEGDVSFGQIVRDRRHALRLTQAKLARRVSCATITIRKIEANGLRPSAQMAKLIVAALEIPEADRPVALRLARAEPGAAAPAPAAAVPIGAPPGDGVDRPVGEPVNPYLGLRAFAEADAAHFFGREDLVGELCARLADPGDLARFLAVVGPSGSGKSSVVKAGLLPALRRGGLPGAANWLFVDITPGARPWEELEAVLRRIAVNPPQTLREQLQDGERGLLQAVGRVLPEDPAVELVLVIDQFEEIFTLVPDEAERAQFLDSLVTACLDPGSRLRLILTLRADFYDRPLQYVDFGELLRQRTLTVLPLAPEELEAAIVRPAALAGVRLETGLTAAIMHDVSGQPGALPLLQYALTELFEARDGWTLTRAAYEATGGVHGALTRRADEIFAALTDAEQALAHHILLRLVTLGEGAEDTRRRVPQAELVGLEVDGVAGTAETVARILAAFGGHRLLTFDHDPVSQAATVEVAHEALLREWGRLRGWLDEKRVDIRLQRQLAEAAREWVVAEGDDSFLLRGARLDAFAARFANAPDANVALTRDEKALLTASSGARQRRRAAEQARQQRELETAQKLAETERQRAQDQAAAAGHLRRRAVYLGAALVVALLLAVAAAAFGRDARQNAGLAATREAVAQANLLQAEQQRLAAQALNSDDAQLRALLALSSLRLGYSEEADLALLAAVAQGFSEHTLQGHFGLVRRMAIAPDGRYLATSGGTDQLVIVWDRQTYEVVHRFELVDLAMDIVFTPDSSFLIMSDFSGHLDRVDLATGALERLFSIPGSNQVVSLDISGQGDLLLAGSRQSAFLYDLSTREQLRQFNHGATIFVVALTPDNRLAITAGLDGMVRIWDAASGAEVRSWPAHQAAVSNMALAPDGRRLLTSSHDGRAKLWNLATGAAEHTFAIGPARQIDASDFDARESALGVAFSPDGERLLISTMTQDLELRDRRSGQLRRRWAGAGGEAVVWTPDGAAVISSNPGAEVNIWPIPDPEYPALLSGHPGAVTALTFSSDGATLLSGGEKELRRWDVASGHVLGQFTSSLYTNNTFDAFTAVAFADDETRMLALTGFGYLEAWDIAGGESEIVNRSADLPAFKNNGFSSNGRFLLLATGFTNRPWGWIQELGAEDSLQYFSTEAPDDSQDSGIVQGLIFGDRVSPDGRWVTQYENRDVRSVNLWDAETGELAYTLTGHTSYLTVADFSRDSRYLLTGAADGTVRVWQTATGAEVQRLVVPNVQILAAAFSDDGRYIVTGDSSGVARLWDAASGAQIRVFGGHHEGGVSAVAFAPDGQHVATGDGAGNIRIWDIDLERTIALICARLPRDFTDLERELYAIPEGTAPCPG